MTDIKVFSAAAFGFGLPGVNLFLQSWEPIIKDLVLLGQFGVAVATIVYIMAKWRKLSPRRRKPKDS